MGYRSYDAKVAYFARNPEVAARAREANKRRLARLRHDPATRAWYLARSRAYYHEKKARLLAEEARAAGQDGDEHI